MTGRSHLSGPRPPFSVPRCIYFHANNTKSWLSEVPRGGSPVRIICSAPVNRIQYRSQQEPIRVQVCPERPPHTHTHTRTRHHRHHPFPQLCTTVPSIFPLGRSQRSFEFAATYRRDGLHRCPPLRRGVPTSTWADRATYPARHLDDDVAQPSKRWDYFFCNDHKILPKADLHQEVSLSSAVTGLDFHWAFHTDCSAACPCMTPLNVANNVSWLLKYPICACPIRLQVCDAKLLKHLATTSTHLPIVVHWI